MSVDVGSIAPDFTLVNQDFQPVTLSQLRGQPVVLAFFFGAFSSVCVNELCLFRDRTSALNEVKAQVLGISVDTPFVLKAFQTEQRLTFPLLSDFNKDVLRLYDVFSEEVIGLRGMPKRSVFLIDKEGVLRYREVLEDARNEPDYAKLFGEIGKL